MRIVRDGSDDILVVANDAHERFPDVYRLNTDTGRKTLRSLGKPGDVVRWVEFFLDAHLRETP